MGFNELFIDDSLSQTKEVNPLYAGAVLNKKQTFKDTGNPVVFQWAERDGKCKKDPGRIQMTQLKRFSSQ